MLCVSKGTTKANTPCLFVVKWYKQRLTLKTWAETPTVQPWDFNHVLSAEPEECYNQVSHAKTHTHTVHTCDHMHNKTNMKDDQTAPSWQRTLCVITLCRHNEALRDPSPPCVVPVTCLAKHSLATCPLHVVFVSVYRYKKTKREEEHRCALF